MIFLGVITPLFRTRRALRQKYPGKADLMMQERTLTNGHGCISCAGPGEGNTFALCIAQSPLVLGTKTAMILASRAELRRWLQQVDKLLEESVV